MSILTQREKASRAPKLDQLYKALAKAQGQFPKIEKTKTGHGYKYADIADILDAVRPVLSQNDLVIMQEVRGDILVTTLGHSSGQEKATTYPLVQDGTGRMNNIQRQGAALTYARRYSLTAMLGVAADEDIDAKDVDIAKHAQNSNKGGNPTSGALRDAWVDGVLDSLPEDASDRDKAKAFSEQLIADFRTYKTAEGLNGSWNKRQSIIDGLDRKHNDLFQNVYDAFHHAMEGFKEEAA